MPARYGFGSHPSQKQHLTLPPARSPSRRIAAQGADQREVVIDQVVSTVDVSAQANIAQALAWRATHYPLEHAADLADDILGRNFRDVLAKKPALEPGTVEYDRLLCILIDGR